jgi:hypothetical protein
MVNTFPRQRKIGVVFYAVRIVLKENRRLVLTRVCFIDVNNAGKGMGFHGFTCVSIQILVVRLMRPFSLVGKYECFGGTELIASISRLDTGDSRAPKYR